MAFTINYDRKAKIELREKTEAFSEFGRYMIGQIRDFEPVWIPKELREFYEGESNTRILKVEDTYGSVFNIPFNVVESIKYY